jgi:glyoxylase-like metal-dependent hydrolase (beta-lactamase superfamily II)
MYPFFDVSTGGSLAGMLAAAEHVLALVDDETKIIPGHGPLSDAAGLRRYCDMLRTVERTVSAQVKAGMSREEIIAAKPTREFDAQFGAGFLQPDVWVGIVLDGMGVGE